MRKRGERTVSELYDFTTRISEPKITPVLEGCFRIQGPVDDLDTLIQGTHSDEKRSFFPNNRTLMRGDTGKCTVCSAPCSMCMHYKSESGFSYNLSSRTEADSCSVINVDEMPILKCRLHDHHAASEISNVISTSSSIDSYSENSKSKTNISASEAYNASDGVSMPQVLFSGKVIEEEQPCSRDTQLSPRLTSGNGDEQNGLEYHDDNIMCISGPGDSSALLCESIVDIKEIDSGSIVSSSVAVNNNISSAEVGGDMHGHQTGKNDYISLIKVEPLFIEGNLNLQPQADTSRCAEKDNLDASLASWTSEKSSENKSRTSPKHEASTEIMKKSGFPSDALHNDVLGHCSRSGSDCGNPNDNSSDDHHANDLFDGDGVIIASANREDQNLEKIITMGENYEIGVALDDVKVCDICGDAGREDLLAICSRCSDGAEHTYCMQKMLDKVPEVEWLCEECKIKETENPIVDECEAVSKRLRSTLLIDVNQTSTSTLNPNKEHKCDTRPTNLDARGSSKGVQGIIGKRQPVHLEEGKASQSSGALTVAASLRNKPILSRQSSSKSQDIGKVKAVETSSEVQPSKGSDNLPRSKTYLCSSSFKGLTPLYSPRGHISRSVSFNNSNVNPNNKTYIENAPPKQKSTREATASDLRKVSLFKSSTKSTFQSATSGLSNTDLAVKRSSSQQSRTEDIRVLTEVKERSTVDKNFFLANSSFRSSAAVACSYPLKFDAKYVELHSDGKLNSYSEASVRSSVEGLESDDLGSSDVKKQVSYSSKCIESSNGNNSAENLKRSKVDKEGIQSISVVDGPHRKFEIMPSHNAMQPLEPVYKGSRMKDSSSSIGSKLLGLEGNRPFHSQRSIETERTAHHTSVDKRGGHTHKTSADRNLREVNKKVNKWREVVNVAMSRSVLKCEKLDTPEDLSAATVDKIYEAASKHTPIALNQKSSFAERKYNKFSSNNSLEALTKTLASVGSRKSDVLVVESSYKVTSIKDTPTTELSGKPFAETMRGDPPCVANILSDSAVPRPSLLACPCVPEVSKSPLLENPLSGTAFPKLECIWQGNFNVIGTGSPPKIFFGIQAHLSNCASHRVFHVATKVRGNIQLEEVSHISSMPLQLLRAGPQEDNIALFFFAKDTESYETSYRKLMEKMHRNDLALRGNVDGAELLIFTSDKLPICSQRWNKMHYLWGMFRGQMRYCMPVMGDEKKSFLANQEFSVPPITEVYTTQNLGTSLELNKLSDSTASNGKPGESISDVNLRTISSYNEDKAGRTSVVSSVQNLLNHVPADPNIIEDQPSFPVGTSSGINAEPLRSIIDIPKLIPQLSTTKSWTKGKYFDKNDGTFQGKIGSDCTARMVGNSLALTSENGFASRLSSVRKESSIPSVSPDCTKGIDDLNIAEKDGEIETLTDFMEDDQRIHVLGTDLNSCDSTPNRKRGRSCSVERKLHPFCELSKSNPETVLPREKPNWLPVENEKEHKKTPYPSTSTTIVKDNVSTRLSSKVHPLHSTISSHWQPGESPCSEMSVSQNTSTTERCFFPLDLAPVPSHKPSNLIDLLSSDDDTPESCSPDLELALGGKNKPSKPFILPSLFHPVDGGKRPTQPGPPGDGDDLLASLSLSL